uniref:Uncharacterized protein n=1 Tax=Ixodes ricinus TaxID=34613 RepID=A0A6B0UNM1_IXORI
MKKWETNDGTTAHTQRIRHYISSALHAAACGFTATSSMSPTEATVASCSATWIRRGHLGEPSRYSAPREERTQLLYSRCKRFEEVLRHTVVSSCGRGNQPLLRRLERSVSRPLQPPVPGRGV